MDLRSIELFLRVADCGSITQASRDLGIVQPALTRHIQRLEQEMGAQLLVRLPRGVQLTMAGRQFVQHCRAILGQVARAQEEIALNRKVEGGRAVLGLSPTVAPSVIPGLISVLSREAPLIELKIANLASPAMFDAVLANRLDLALISNPPAHAALQLTPVLSEPIVVLAPPQPRGMRAFYTTRELMQSRIIITTHIRAIVEEQLRPRGTRLPVASEIDSIEAIRRLLLRGIGPTLMPASTFHADIQAGRIAAWPVKDANLYRILTLVTLGNAEPPPAVRTVARVLRSEIERMAETGVFTPIGPPEQR